MKTEESAVHRLHNRAYLYFVMGEPVEYLLILYPTEVRRQKEQARESWSIDYDRKPLVSERLNPLRQRP